MSLAGLRRVLLGGGEAQVEPTEPVDADTMAMIKPAIDAARKGK